MSKGFVTSPSLSAVLSLCDEVFGTLSGKKTGRVSANESRNNPETQLENSITEGSWKVFLTVFDTFFSAMLAYWKVGHDGRRALRKNPRQGGTYLKFENQGSVQPGRKTNGHEGFNSFRGRIFCFDVQEGCDMHMADALLSPAVGGTMWGASMATLAWCARKLRDRLEGPLVPYMGVLGAFVFAAQMINFTIPGTGSSGHLGGGLLLAILLGPYAAFLVIASVLFVQAFFFADGGLLALGCNIWNLGMYPCFFAYPLIYRPLVGEKPSHRRIAAMATVAAVASLQLGALSVVLQTFLSGISELPLKTFLLFMQPVHLGIGIVEGVVTASVVVSIGALDPGVISLSENSRPKASPLKSIALLGVLTLLVGGGLSWFASSHPDGLEWSIEKVTAS